jgi:hypothetical protein
MEVGYKWEITGKLPANVGFAGFNSNYFNKLQYVCNFCREMRQWALMKRANGEPGRGQSFPLTGCCKTFLCHPEQCEGSISI